MGGSCHLPRENFSGLLQLIKKSGRFHPGDVPNDPRTLLKTPRSNDVINKCGGQYIYFGLERGIANVLNNSAFKENDLIYVDINIDGLPLHKSSNRQFWPILCKVVKSTHQPFVVALYCGTQKPDNVNEFLYDFVVEANELYEKGMNIDDNLVFVRVRAIICDAPARAFVKCVAGHNSKNGCERCVVEAESINHTVVYLNGKSVLRNDAGFRADLYPNHKVSDSLILQLHNIDIIRSFVLDVMHLVFLGVCRRMLQFLKKGPLKIRLSHAIKDSISRDLVSIAASTPSEFARRPRSFFELDRWKATEFRQFVLYTGIVVLRDKISKNLYELFLVLSIAMTILHNNDNAERKPLLKFAKKSLQSFVYNATLLLGKTFVTYNTHNLLHIVDDVNSHPAQQSCINVEATFLATL